MYKRYHIFFSGAVQGVGFRYAARALGERYNLNGWVKNLADARVEVEAEGEHSDLDNFLRDLKKEFKSYIKDIELQELPHSGECQDFHIRF
ncbi:MAG: acylphosphatase [Candidatus Omnitrophota bacterium]|nr:acylphosphatase [Candidatus Omnitrophota bacterium]